MMKCVFRGGDILGEAPLWDHRKSLFYWVDIEAEKIHCLDLSLDVHKEWKMPSRPGSLALHGKGGLIVALSQEIVHFLPASGEIFPIKGTQIEGNIRFNDGKCDPQGRYWVGSMDLEEKNPIGTLYCLDRQNFLTKDQDIVISNGLGWSPDFRVFYFTDSPKRTIYRYEFDAETGEITHRQVFAIISPDAGYPDGLCVDQAGYVWSAHFMGGRITRYAPDGHIDQVLEVPALCPTSCCFGGDAGDQLFITTATRDLTEIQKQENPLNGGVFMFKMGEGIRGRKEAPYQVFDK